MHGDVNRAIRPLDDLFWSMWPALIVLTCAAALVTLDQLPLWIYLLVGGAWAFNEAIQHIARFLSPVAATAVAGPGNAAALQPRTLSGARFMAQGLCFAFGGGCCWPVPLIAKLRRLPLRPMLGDSRARITSYENLFPSDAPKAILNLAFVSSVVLAHEFVNVHPNKQSLVLNLAILQSLLYISGYAISPSKFVPRLRQSARAVWLHVIVIAVPLFVSLLLGLAQVDAWRNALPLTFEAMVDTARKVFTFSLVLWAIQNPVDAWQQWGWRDWQLCVAAPVLSFGILSTVRRLDRYKRTDDDLLTIADRFLELGLYDQAMAWSDKVKEPGPLALTLRANLVFASGRLEEALALSVRTGHVGLEDPLDIRYAWLLHLSRRTPPEKVVAAVRVWLSHDPADYRLALGCLAITNDHEDIVANLLEIDGLSVEQFPLTCGMLELMRHRPDDVAKCLHAASASNEIERICSDMIQLLAWCDEFPSRLADAGQSRHAITEAIRRWMTEGSPVPLELLHLGLMLTEADFAIREYKPELHEPTEKLLDMVESQLLARNYLAESMRATRRLASDPLARWASSIDRMKRDRLHSIKDNALRIRRAQRGEK